MRSQEQGQTEIVGPGDERGSVCYSHGFRLGEAGEGKRCASLLDIHSKGHAQNPGLGSLPCWSLPSLLPGHIKASVCREG